MMEQTLPTINKGDTIVVSKFLLHTNDEHLLPRPLDHLGLSTENPRRLPNLLSHP